MKKNKGFILILSVFFFIPLLSDFFADAFYLPISVENRRILKQSYISPAGEFGIWRKPYNKIRGHYHAGIDLKNPGSKSGAIEPIYACASGVVLSVWSNRSSSCVIITHNLRAGGMVYSAYTHISDIVVSAGDTVDQYTVIGSFIDRPKLDKWGEYLNHIHFEMLKVRPKSAGRVNGREIYASYSIDILRKNELNKFFYDPKIFFIDK